MLPKVQRSAQSCSTCKIVLKKKKKKKKKKKILESAQRNQARPNVRKGTAPALLNDRSFISLL